MRVIIVTQYFPPETGGPQNRIASIAKGIRDAGHEVRVITSKPNYPKGIIWPDYRGGLFKSSRFEGIDVLHTWVWGDAKKTFLARIRFFLSFVVMAVLAAWREKGRFDVVLATSPPLFVGIAGWIISRLKRARYIFDVRDLWPDVAVSMGELSNPRFIRLAKSLEKFIYRRADGITAVTRSFCDAIRETAGPGSRVALVMNGTEPELFAIKEDRAALRAGFGFDREFVVLYAGNLGLAQGLDHILEAAERERERHHEPRTIFLFLGDGAAKDRLVGEAGQRNLSNVRFEPTVPLKSAVRYMHAADVLLVPLARAPIYKMFIPSKLFDSMAVGRPVALSVPGESRAVLEAAGAGVYYNPESAAGLVEALDTLRARAGAADTLTSRSRAYVAEHFDRRVLAARLVRFLEEIVDGA